MSGEASRAAPTRASWRDAWGAALRQRRALAALELLLVALALVLRMLGAIRNPSLLILLGGAFSLWLRRSGWRGVGLAAPRSWGRTLLLGIAIGIAYDALDVFVLLPALHRLTGESLKIESLGELRGHVGALLAWIGLTWTFAAFGEELAYRGYVLNRLTDLLGRGRGALWASAIVTSLLFGVAHGAQGSAGVADNVLAGILLATLYLASGRNLWLPIVVHGVVDTTSFVLLYLGYSPR